MRGRVHVLVPGLADMRPVLAIWLAGCNSAGCGTGIVAVIVTAGFCAGTEWRRRLAWLD